MVINFIVLQTYRVEQSGKMMKISKMNDYSWNGYINFKKRIPSNAMDFFV